MNADVRTIAFFAHEYWFGRRLLHYGIDISGGITTAAQREARARRGILERGIALKRVMLNKPDTFADLFERLYGVPLSESTPALSPTQLEVTL